jgi:peroxiredoxin
METPTLCAPRRPASSTTTWPASYGRTSVGVLRSTFLVDEQGRIERAWHNVKADGHAATVLAQLQG